jgi:hypothetical protein
VLRTLICEILYTHIRRSEKRVLLLSQQQTHTHTHTQTNTNTHTTKCSWFCEWWRQHVNKMWTKQQLSIPCRNLSVATLSPRLSYWQGCHLTASRYVGFYFRFSPSLTLASLCFTGSSLPTPNYSATPHLQNRCFGLLYLPSTPPPSSNPAILTYLARSLGSLEEQDRVIAKYRTPQVSYCARATSSILHIFLMG